jgi:hypothetical protein
MLPYLTKTSIDCGMSIGLSVFCGLKDCGHKGVDIEIKLLLWRINMGIELKG